VVVLGGAEKVRDPREPELPPPPTRASADEIAIARGTATTRRVRSPEQFRACVARNFMCFSSIPGMGKRP
jgi:hypothetical protein